MAYLIIIAFFVTLHLPRINNQVDGCATFWRRNKFVLVEDYAVEFNDIARQEVPDLDLTTAIVVRA